MPLCPDIDAFLASLPAQGRLLGGDLGTKTLGLALTDEGRRLASPLTVIELTKFTPDAQKLAKLIADHKVAGLVVGLPLNMDGSAGPRAQASRQFIDNLIQLGAPFADLPMLLADERLSTAAVERMMIGADLSRKRRGEVVDKLAASYILQGVLDRMDKIANTDARLPDEITQALREIGAVETGHHSVAQGSGFGQITQHSWYFQLGNRQVRLQWSDIDGLSAQVAGLHVTAMDDHLWQSIFSLTEPGFDSFTDAQRLDWICKAPSDAEYPAFLATHLRRLADG